MIFLITTQCYHLFLISRATIITSNLVLVRTITLQVLKCGYNLCYKYVSRLVFNLKYKCKLRVLILIIVYVGERQNYEILLPLCLLEVALMLACFVSSDDKFYNSYLKLVYTFNGLVLLSKFALLL